MSISVCIIAKNEAGSIGRAVSSVASGVDEVVVVDTGSTDDTQEIAALAGAKVVFYRWNDDFSAARNFALDQASGDWVLQLDADEVLAALPSSLSEVINSSSSDAFFCELVNLASPHSLEGSTRNNIKRLFRRCDWRYRGAIHEGLEFQLKRKPSLSESGLQILHWGYIPGPLMEAKGRRNQKLLEEAIERDPKDALIHSYLGDCLIQSGQWGQALEAFLEADRHCDGSGKGLRALLALRICRCLLESGNLEAGRKRVAREVKNYFDYRDILFLAGQIYEASGEWAEAAKWYARCIETPRRPDRYLITQDSLDVVAAESLRECRRRARG